MLVERLPAELLDGSNERVPLVLTRDSVDAGSQRLFRPAHAENGTGGYASSCFSARSTPAAEPSIISRRSGETLPLISST